MSRGPHNRWLLYYLSKDMLVCSAILPAIYLHYPHLQRFLAELCRNDQGGPLDVVSRVIDISTCQPCFKQHPFNDDLEITLKFKPSFDTFCIVGIYQPPTFLVQWFRSCQNLEQVGMSCNIYHRCADLKACNCPSNGNATGQVLEISTRGALSSNLHTYSAVHPILPVIFGTGLQNIVTEQEKLIFEHWLPRFPINAGFAYCLSAAKSLTMSPN
jgi:hypothetical protein